MNRTLRHAVPHALTLSRLLLGLAFPAIPPGWRLVVVTVAALTDLFDGLTARWLRAESATGRLLDPLADKVFVLMLTGTLLAEGRLGLLSAAALASRDVVVALGLVAVAVRGRWSVYRRMRPTWLGKAATAAQFAFILVLLAEGSVWPWLWGVTAALGLAAAIDYARAFARRRESGTV